jgi:hypothetical protein
MDVVAGVERLRAELEASDIHVPKNRSATSHRPAFEFECRSGTPLGRAGVSGHTVDERDEETSSVSRHDFVFKPPAAGHTERRPCVHIPTRLRL